MKYFANRQPGFMATVNGKVLGKGVTHCIMFIVYSASGMYDLHFTFSTFCDVI